MKKNLNKLLIAILPFCFLLIFHSAALSDASIDGVIERVEKAIVDASDLFEQGKIKKGNPYTVNISPEIQLSFSEETFDADIEKTFQILAQMMMQKKTEKTDQTVSVPEQGSSTPDSRSHKHGDQPDDRINALKQAEKKTDTASPQPEDKIPSDYSVYKNYHQTHQERITNQDKAAEADMQAVIAERQAAAENLKRKMEREQQLQAQATKWQEQLDKQASASARAAAAWEAENSFGAYAKKFLGMVIQTSIGAFTGGFLGTLSTNFANHAVKKLFPNVDTSTLSQAAAAGTSSAITGTASSVGQAATSSVTGAIAGQGQQQGQNTQPQY